MHQKRSEKGASVVFIRVVAFKSFYKGCEPIGCCLALL